MTFSDLHNFRLTGRRGSLMSS